MLVLSRKQGEVIEIGDEIEITVLEISGTRVKLGIDAPQHVRIKRKEIKPDPATQWALEGVQEYGPLRELFNKRGEA